MCTRHDASGAPIAASIWAVYILALVATGGSWYLCRNKQYVNRIKIDSLRHRCCWAVALIWTIVLLGWSVGSGTWAVVYFTDWMLIATMATWTLMLIDDSIGWVALCAVLPTTIFLVIVYWTAVYNPGCTRHMALTVCLHGSNLIPLFVEFKYSSGRQIALHHVVYVQTFLSMYMTVLLTAYGKRNMPYSFIDPGQPLAALVYVGLYLGCCIVYVLFWRIRPLCLITIPSRLNTELLDDVDVSVNQIIMRVDD